MHSFCFFIRLNGLDLFGFSLLTSTLSTLTLTFLYLHLAYFPFIIIRNWPRDSSASWSGFMAYACTSLKKSLERKLEEIHQWRAYLNMLKVKKKKKW